MKNSQAMILGAAIAVGAIGAWVMLDEPDTLGEHIDEGVEEVRDEIDDATTGK